MGLFDTVCVLMPLPDFPAEAERDFQTKTLDDPYLRVYDLTADGRLVQIEAGGHEPITGSLPHDTEFHGVLNFYTYIDAVENWWEYNATFTDGLCVSVERVREP